MSFSKSTVIKKRGLGPLFLFVFPALIVIFAVSIYPVIFSLYLSFTDRTLLYLRAPRFVGFSNYSNVVWDKLFWHSLKLQLSFMLLAIPLELFVGFLVALLFLKDFPLCRLLRTLLMLPVFILPVVSGLTWRLMLQPGYGLLASFFNSISLGPKAWLADTKYAFVTVVLQDIWRMWPFMFMIIYAGLSSLPSEYLEAAQIDGAKFWQRVFYIIVPLLKPVMMMAMLLRMIDALRIFSEVYVMTYGGPANATLLLPLYIHKQAFEFGKVAYASAASVFLLAVSLALSFYLVRASFRGEVL